MFNECFFVVVVCSIKLTTSGPSPPGEQRACAIWSGMLDSLYIFGSTAGWFSYRWFIYSYLIETAITKNKKTTPKPTNKNQETQIQLWHSSDL